MWISSCIKILNFCHVEPNLLLLQTISSPSRRAKDIYSFSHFDKYFSSLLVVTWQPISRTSFIYPFLCEDTKADLANESNVCFRKIWNVKFWYRFWVRRIFYCFFVRLEMHSTQYLNISDPSIRYYWLVRCFFFVFGNNLSSRHIRQW